MSRAFLVGASVEVERRALDVDEGVAHTVPAVLGIPVAVGAVLGSAGRHEGEEHCEEQVHLESLSLSSGMKAKQVSIRMWQSLVCRGLPHHPYSAGFMNEAYRGSQYVSSTSGEKNG